MDHPVSLDLALIGFCSTSPSSLTIDRYLDSGTSITPPPLSLSLSELTLSSSTNEPTAPNKNSTRTNNNSSFLPFSLSPFPFPPQSVVLRVLPLLLLNWRGKRGTLPASSSDRPSFLESVGGLPRLYLLGLLLLSNRTDRARALGEQRSLL